MSSSRVVGAALGLLGAAAYAVLTLLRFHQYRLSSWDNAIFEQAIAGYARLDAPIVDVKAPGFHILGDHFSPIDAIVAPFYRVWPSAQTVLLAQVLLIGVSIAVVASLAARVLGTWWGVTIGTLYAVSFGLQSAVESDFHEVAFAAPLLTLAGAAYVERRPTAVVLWAAPLVLVKEDLGVTVAAIGAVLWLTGERRRGLWLGVGGLVATVLTVAVLIPAFASDGAYPYTSALGGDRGLLATLLDDPGTKLGTVALTVGVTGLAALLSPWVLVALPTFAWRFAGDNASYWGTDWHYSLVLMPIVFVAMVDAIQRFDRARWLVPAAVVVSAWTLVGSPLAGLLDDATWQDPPRAAAAREVVAAVPEGASVETDIGLLTHLVTGREAYWTGTIGLGDRSVTPDYVAFDVASGLGSPADVLGYAEDTYGGTWTTVVDRDGYVLVRRGRP